MTCLGINNEGYLRYDYYHEDIGRNDAVGQTYVYNGYDSVLWNNFAEAFADDIQKTYSSWRSGTSPLLSYENIIKYFITNQSDKWSISIYNDDAEYKYISLYRNNNNSDFLYQVKGTGEEHLKYFVKNRLMYCDSKWQTGDFVNKDTNTILLRLNSPNGIEDDEIKPDMNIKFRTFSNMYAGVRYGTNGVLNSQYTNRGDLVSIAMPDGENPNNLDTYIFGANEISELEDLSLLYANLINLSAASKLTKAIIGNDHPNYRNDVLKNISFSNNRLLKEVNICNCTGLTNIIDFSLCPDIQYIYATGSNISGVQIPESGFIKVLRLPNTISNISLINQHHIEEFFCEGYDNLTTIRIENSENVPIQDILMRCNPDVLASVSIKNTDWNVDSEENLSFIIDKMIACDGSVLEGTVYLPEGVSISNELKKRSHKYFNKLTIIDANPIFYIDYCSYDNTIWDTEVVEPGGNAMGPSKGSPTDVIQDAQGLRHLFVKWASLPVNVNQNYQIDATWITQYAVRFYSEDTLLYTQWVDYGEDAQDPVASGDLEIPTKEESDEVRYRYTKWDNLPKNVLKAVSVYAQYDVYWAVKFLNDGVIHYVEWIKNGEKPQDPSNYLDYVEPTRESTAEYNYYFDVWDGDFNLAVTRPREFYAMYSSEVRIYTVSFYTGDKLLAVYNQPFGSNVAYASETPTKQDVTDPENYQFQGWIPAPENITGDMNCYAFFIYTGYITDSWTTIAQNIENGMAPYVYKTGQRKAVPITLNGSDFILDFEIAAFGHDYLTDDSAKAGITFLCKNLSDLKHCMNLSNSNKGGWDSSEMRRFVNDELFYALPEDLKLIIESVHKISDGGASNNTLVTTDDRLWLASCAEVGVTSSSLTVSGQGTKYSSVFDSTNKSRRKEVADDVVNGNWWLRSSNTGKSGEFLSVKADGSITSASASNELSVVVGFCIGVGGNLYKIAEDPNSTGIYNNGLGYKNNTYLSSDGNGTVDGTVSSTSGYSNNVVSTGAIPYVTTYMKKPPTIIIRGADWIENTHCRLRFLGNNKKSTLGPWLEGGYAANDAHNIGNCFTIERVVDEKVGKYIKLIPIKQSDGKYFPGGGAGGTADGVGTKYIRMSLIGTGENLHITFED